MNANELGWDGSNTLSSMVLDSQSSWLLELIRKSGEMISSACEVFNANLEVSKENSTFEEVMEMCIL